MPVFPMIMVWLAGLLSAGLAVAELALPPPTGMGGLGALLLIIAAALVRWVVLALALSHCVVAGGFRWLRAPGWRWVAVMAGHLALGGLSAVSMFVVLEPHATVGLPPGLGRVLLTLAKVGCTVPAVAVIAFLCVVTRPAPVLAGHAAGALVGAGAGGLAGLLVAGALVGQDVMNERGRAAAELRGIEARQAEYRQRLGELTDADPLLRWDEFVGGDVPGDVAAEALRRLSLRPGLERDLEAALACDCRNPSWSAELLWLFNAIPFTPSGDLAGPVGQAMAALTANIGDTARAADADERDIYVDRYLGRHLEVVPAAALRLARAAGADLRPAVLQMRAAVLEHYPRSEAARSFPLEADRTVGEIAAVLQARGAR